MTRDEFEAVLWREIGTTATVAAVDAILAAADQFAATTAATTLAIDGHRRQPAVHYLNPRWPEPSCGYGRGMRDPALTSDTGQVTCGKCKKSGAYRNALALAVAS